MTSEFRLKPAWLASLLAFLAWSAVFAVLYGQSPLYTSNQNTYYLHGLAQAGFGYLDRDWLANTRELMPLFSRLVALTYWLFHSEVPSYAYYALLMGVYLYAMYGIMDLYFDLHRSKARTLAFVALVLAFHSAALRYILSKGFGSEAAFLLEGGVAGQRILGQVFQPSVFGIFLVLSIYLFLCNRFFWALLALAVAIYFHPVYLLSGALLTLTYMWVILREDRNLKRPLLIGMGSLLLVAPSVVYTISLSWPFSGEVAQKALDVLVNFRNPHHALLSEWLDWTVVVKAIILLAAMVIVRKTRLFPILGTVTLGILALTVVQLLTGSQTLALLFPWRVSVLLVPLCMTVIIAFALTRMMDGWKTPAKAERPVIITSLLLIAGLMVAGVMRFKVEYDRQLSDPIYPLTIHVARHKSSEDVYLVLPKMSNFRLATGAPIYVDFDTTPDRNEDVLEWYRRLQRAYTFYYENPEACLTIQELNTDEGVTHAVLETGSPLAGCPGLEQVYQDPAYTLYAINP